MRTEKSSSNFGSSPRETTHLLNLAESHLRARRYKEAEDCLEKIRSAGSPLAVQAYRYHYLRGLALFWQGEQTAAWKEAEEALNLFTRTRCLPVLPTQDNLPTFVKENLKRLREIEIALLEGMEGKNLDAGGLKRKLLERRIAEISSSLENLSPLAKLHQLAGSILTRLGKQPEALEHLEWAATAFRLARNWGSLAETLNRIALLLVVRGELQPAIQILEQAKSYSLKAENNYFELVLRSNVAHCQLLVGNWRPPLSSLPDVLEETKKAGDFPRYATTLLSWGWTHLLRGRFKESRKALERARRICLEKNLVGVLAFCYGYLADLCMVEGRLEEAEMHLKKVLEIAEQVTPHGGPVAEAWQKVGELHLARKEFDRALKAFDTCQAHLQKHPEKLVEGAVYRGMGICHVKTEHLRLGQKEFKKAIDIFESCGNEWELAKTAVIATENGAFATAEIYPKLVWAKEIFKKLEHPAWRRKARALLEPADLADRDIPLRQLHELAEKERIVKALAETDGNVSRAARKLGILRQTLQYKIRQYKIKK